MGVRPHVFGRLSGALSVLPKCAIAFSVRLKPIAWIRIRVNPRNKGTRKKYNQSRLILLRLLRSSLWQPQNLLTPDQQT